MPQCIYARMYVRISSMINDERLIIDDIRERPPRVHGEA